MIIQATRAITSVRRLNVKKIKNPDAARPTAMTERVRLP
jgi:hypothetical protein